MKKRLRQLIAKGKTPQAIEALLRLTGSLGERDLHEEAVMLSAQYERYAKAQRLGTATAEENKVTLAAINNGLLGMISQLPEKEEAGIENAEGNGKSPKPSSREWWQWVVGAGVIVGILAGIATIFGSNLSMLFGKKEAGSFSVTVLVHGKEGRDGRILRNQGEVVLDFGAARQEASIDDDGEATFKELPLAYLGEKVLISIDHPQPYFPVDRDSAYTLERGKAIYLEVELKGTDKVQGRVLDYQTEGPLDSVRVSYQDVVAYTDESGWYELNIPPDKQAKFIRLTFYKEGYKMETIDSIAPHTRQEIGLSLKRQLAE